MAGYDWDPAEELLREHELEDELMLASGRPAQNPVPDSFEPQDALSPVTQSPVLESHHMFDSRNQPVIAEPSHRS